MNRLAPYLISFAILISCPNRGAAEEGKIFKTKYTGIHYIADKDIDDFIWRLGGQRLLFTGDASLASHRVDRIVERVQTILDMRPHNFHVDIYLHRGLTDRRMVAFYEERSKSIRISVDYTTDGVLAHEIAHAVIDQYFVTSPPSKVQEILTQYVDKYLWSDY